MNNGVGKATKPLNVIKMKGRKSKKLFAKRKYPSIVEMLIRLIEVLDEINGHFTDYLELEKKMFSVKAQGNAAMVKLVGTLEHFEDVRLKEEKEQAERIEKLKKEFKGIPFIMTKGKKIKTR